MKIKEVVTATRDMDINITGITLLNEREYEFYKSIIPNATNSSTWWLRPLALQTGLIFSYVNENGNVNISDFPSYEIREVRPVLLFDACDVKVGARFRFGGYSWTVLSSISAICDSSIGECHFIVSDIDKFKESNIKEFIEGWLEEEINK